MTNCKTCELVAQRDAGEAPSWDNIHRTDHWDVVHNYNTTLPGWLVLVTRRHIASIAEMTAGESAELGPLIQKTSAALKEAVACEKTYVIQFAEAADHPHVHFHIVPRMADMPKEKRAGRVFAYKPEEGEEGVSEIEMNRIGEIVQSFMIGTL